MSRLVKWMNRFQCFRVISIFGALITGLWLPVRVLDFNLPIYWDIIFDLFIACISVLNLWLHFEKHEESAKTFKHWLTLGVILDVICFIPFSLLEYLIFNTISPISILLNILVTRHIWKIKEFLDDFDNLQPVIYRLVPLALMMPLLVHLTACAWIALGSGTAGPDTDKVFEYVKALYWSFATLTTVGYGDIVAKTAPQMLFASMVQIAGVGVFGFILSNVASLLSRLDAAREHHMDSRDKIETYMKSHQIPTQLRAKVRSYYHYLWTNHRGYSDHSLLEGLPYKMRSEMFLFINKSIIEKVAFLKGASLDLLEDLMNEMKPAIFVPDERIFRIGDAGDEMYFIHNGQVEIISKENKTLAILSDGAFFGEMALVTDATRNAHAKAITYCDAYKLSKKAFQKVLTTHPEFKKHIEEVMRARTVQK
jgi:hypothetical protein